MVGERCGLARMLIVAKNVAHFQVGSVETRAAWLEWCDLKENGGFQEARFDEGRCGKPMWRGADRRWRCSTPGCKTFERGYSYE